MVQSPSASGLQQAAVRGHAALIGALEARDAAAAGTMMKQNLLRPMKELYDLDYERTASRFFLQQAQICIMIVHIIRMLRRRLGHV
ncbi:hypothetical protein M5W83_04555 [Paenibacillus thiaminolyticus]|uniref:FCD domain-containing protein n=1 Tax=Paenibacillus thiaminolyticus TaxID=49283 RepID=A0AAP9J4C8_PANTH|nr:hypothetical protein [Paenibacillus thiaminolyticus]MCY9535074.1 hypothetical protein [Paenibacillus thiaminolyticus]MCY9600451.1 hypothetical protein [Paenibacillus thiaminolyticus]MCY9606430.1 hypothetical protein [Paenibacillus thiaminolyticus]MCY9616055.1 hypothetical protein [Paenibacillus thiaminolyticus]MCY9622361.1 hypothetical protein [Paenibacillus thiaminolyticus]